eukprot:6176866-Prymnesium_polylepis.1
MAGQDARATGEGRGGIGGGASCEHDVCPTRPSVSSPDLGRSCARAERLRDRCRHRVPRAAELPDPSTD